MVNNDINERVKEALDRTDIMALSTIGEDGSWTSPVQYSYDEKINLYFLSKSDSKHVQNILKGPGVSVAIYKDVPFPDGGNLGLQIKGKAEDITGQPDSENWHRFKITPEEVWLFDSRIKQEREKLDLEELNL